jgi:hypothetical protein
MNKIFMGVFALFLLVSCNDGGLKTNSAPSLTKSQNKEKNEDNDDKGPSSEEKDEDPSGEEKIKATNGIKIKASGDVKVAMAYLIYGDTETKVPASNETTPGRPVKVVIVIEKGWKEEDGEISIGASEKIETSSGEVLLETGDMFEKYPSMKAELGNRVSLKANITGKAKEKDEFLINFRVWDKKGESEIKGSYILRMAE